MVTLPINYISQNQTGLIISLLKTFTESLDLLEKLHDGGSQITLHDILDHDGFKNPS